MSYARLQTKLLNARDEREKVLGKVLKITRKSVVFASTSIPGPDKCPQGSDLLFKWLLQEIGRTFGSVCWHLPVTYDVLGPHAIFSVTASSEITKHACVGIEETSPLARLIDLDVYEPDGGQIGRADLGLAARRCLLCNHAATECIRLGRHNQGELDESTARLLEPFILSCLP